MKRTTTRRGGAEPPRTRKRDPALVLAIENKEVLSFLYEGEYREVEPQTYGISTAGNPALRARQISGGSRSGKAEIAKLFNVEKISALRKTGAHFAEALPEHNPNDNAMIEIFASLPHHSRRAR